VIAFHVLGAFSNDIHIQMSQETLDRLVVSIQERRLVAFCGAGLSMAQPSSVPSAQILAGQVVRDYQDRALPALPADAKATLEALTEYLWGHDLQQLFVNELVKWRPFRRSPNIGHRTIADLLTSEALQFCVTTNYDELVELSATDLGEDCFDAAYDLDSAARPHLHRPYIKLHGCVRDKEHTLWCRRQLGSPPPVSPVDQELRRRITSLKTWLAANLPQKDLLFVGFWSDWHYLNQVLEDCVTPTHVPLVILVDPNSDDVLTTKAPVLWKWAAASTKFEHIAEKGEVFLDQLRNAFSRNLLTQVLLKAVPGFQAIKTDAPTPAVTFDGVLTEDLHALRRDVYGVPASRIARFSRPDDSMNAVGRAHLLLRHAGATLEGPRYVTAMGRKVRVINGKTRLISQTKANFAEDPPAVGGLDDDYVLCAGATAGEEIHSDVVRESDHPGVVRAGTKARWITLQTATNDGLC
jgi:hypothetical protein